MSLVCSSSVSLVFSPMLALFRFFSSLLIFMYCTHASIDLVRESIIKKKLVKLELRELKKY